MSHLAARTRLLPASLAAVALLGACSSNRQAHDVPLVHQLTPAEVDAILDPPVSKKVVHCARMAYGKMSVASCADHAIAKDHADTSEPTAAPGDYVWDPSPMKSTHPVLPRFGFLPGVPVTVERAIDEDPTVDSGLGARYVDLWAARHGMTHRDVTMEVPMEDEPVRVEWAHAPQGSTLQAGDLSVELPTSRGAVIVIMTKGDLNGLDHDPRALSLTLPAGGSLPLAPTR